MTTIRRTYAYLLAFAGLAILATALANLAQLLIDVLLQAPIVGAERYVRDTVSLWGAAALVGLPAWLLHWLWIERTARSDPKERTSALRAVYLYVVLAGAVLVMANSIGDVLRGAFDAIQGTRAPAVTLDAVVRPLPFALVALLVWFAHWRITTLDRQRVGEGRPTATLRRWYLYGAAFVGLVILLNNARQVLESVWRIAVGGGASAAAGMSAPAAYTLVGLSLWLAHWFVLPARLPETSRRDDGTAVLRSVFLFVALALAVIGTLVGASQLLYYAVGRLLGVARPGGVGGDLLQAAAGPASVAIVYGAAWVYQRAALRRQSAAFDEAPRQAGIRRLYTYLIALVALAVLAFGVSGLLWTLGDVLFSPGATNGDYWRERVALFATLAIVGLPVWLLHWRPSPVSAAETHSLARRLYLYLSLIVAMLTLIGSLAGALYRLIGLALGESFSGDVTTDLAHALGVACVATVFAAYHWRVLRADAGRALVETSTHETSSPELLAPAALIVEIHAADADTLSRALSALRSTGVQVTVLQPQAQQ